MDTQRPRLSAAQVAELRVGDCCRSIRGNRFTVHALLIGQYQERVAVLRYWHKRYWVWRYVVADAEELEALYTPL